MSAKQTDVRFLKNTQGVFATPAFGAALAEVLVANGEGDKMATEVNAATRHLANEGFIHVLAALERSASGEIQFSPSVCSNSPINAEELVTKIASRISPEKSDEDALVEITRRVMITAGDDGLSVRPASTAQFND